MVNNYTQEQIDVINQFVANHYRSLVELASDHVSKSMKNFNPNNVGVDDIQYLSLSICADKEKAIKLEKAIKENIGVFGYNKDYKFGTHAIVIDIGNHQKLRISYGEKSKHRVRHPAIVQPLIDSIIIPDGNFEFIIDVLPEIYSKNPKNNVPPLNKLEEKLLTQDGRLNHKGNDIRCKDIAILTALLDKKDIALTDSITTSNFGFLSDGRPIVIDLNSAITKETLNSSKVKRAHRKISNDFHDKLKKHFLPPKNQLPTADDYKKSYAEHLEHLGLKMGEIKGHITLDQLNKAFEEDPTNRLLFTIEKLGIYGEDAKNIVALRALEIMENSKLPDEQKKKLFADAVLAARQNPQEKSK